MPDVRDRWAAAVQVSQLSDPAKVTAWVLREHANREGEATVGVRRIADRRALSLGAIYKHLTELETAGLIQRLAGQGTKGLGGTTARTCLRIPASVYPQEVNASSEVSVHSQEVNASPSESVHYPQANSSESVHFSPESVHLQEVNRTIKTIREIPSTRRTAVAANALHQEVIDVYHELLPNLPRVIEWGQEAASNFERAIAHRLAAGKPGDTLEYWRKVLQVVADNAFLSGRSHEKRSRHVGSLKWLFAKSERTEAQFNLIDVLEGHYSKRETRREGMR